MTYKNIKFTELRMTSVSTYLIMEVDSCSVPFKEQQRGTFLTFSFK